MADTPNRRVHVGAAQLAEHHLDREGTIEKDCRYIHEAGDRGLDLLAFPEFHVPSRPTWYRFIDDVDFEEYYARLFEQAVTVPGPATDRLAEAAADAGVAVVVGVTEKEPDTAGTMYNTLVFIDADGQLLGRRRKLVPTIDERLFHTGGTGRDVRTFEASVGTLGGLMCGEHTNQLAKFATLALGESVHVGAWPAFHYWGREKREAFVLGVSREHAIAGAVPVVVATGVLTQELADEVGLEDVDTDSGTTAIIAPDGTTLAGPEWSGEGIVQA
ncbi:MAG: nitrilase-related carbon-nitrogen hydrolase [Halobacteriales archaeon]